MYQLKKRILIFLELLVVASSACWNELPLLRTGTFQPISTLTAPNSNITTISVPFNSFINTTSQLFWGLGLVGYDNYLTATFSFNTTVTIFNTTGITVTVKPEDSTYMVSLRLMYIVTSLVPSALPRIELLHGCFKCLKISQDVNVSQGLGIRNQSFFQPSLMAYSLSIQTRSFLYSFNFSNIYGQLNYLQIGTKFNANWTYTHTVITKEYNNINYVCLSTVSWDYADNKFGKGTAAFFETYVLNNTINATLVTPYDAFNCTNVFFMGFSKISHLMGMQRTLGVNPEKYISLSSSFTSNSNFSSANLTIFYVGYLFCDPGMSKYYLVTLLSCDVTCLAPYNAVINNNCTPCDTNCFACSATDPNTCTQCIAVTNRTGSTCDCSGIYFSNSSNRSSNCLVCSDYMPYCTSCNNSYICLSCASSKPYVVNGSCQCLNISVKTYFVTGICLTYPGCINASSITNAKFCDICNSSAKFQHVSSSNLTCICATGYNNDDNPNLCIPNCGDGTVNNEGCDDGNRVSGDGCSSTCKVENNRYCYVNNGTTGPSHCLNISTASISYLYAQRVIGTNTALLYFTFTPTSYIPSAALLAALYSNASLSNFTMPSNAFSGAVTSNAPLSSITSTYNSANSRITLLVAFTGNLEGNSYNFTFYFTSAQVYYSAPISVLIVPQGVNEQLKFESYGVLVKSMQYVLMGTAFLGLGLGLVCAGAGYKLMGLELLLPMQAGFFAEFGMVNPPPYVSTLKGLKYTLGYNQLLPYDSQKYAGTNSRFAKFDFQIEMALNINVMAGVLLLGTLILLILQLIYLYRYSSAATEQRALAPPRNEEIKKNNKGKKEEKVVFEVKEEGESGLALKSARQNRNTYVNNFYFYFSVILCQETLFCFIIQNSQFSVNDFYLSEDINLMTGYLAILLVIGNLIFILCQLAQKKDRRIITFQETRVFKYPIFLIYSCTFITLIIAITLTYSFAAYITAVLTFLPLFGLLYFRPYRHEDSFLNAFSAFLNLAFPFVAAAIYLVNNVIALSEMGWLLSVVVIIVWQFATETVQIIRMVKVIPWRELPLFERCLKKKKKMDDGLLEKGRVEAEMSSMVKDSIKGEKAKIVDWEEKNKKDYESISNKPDNDDEAEMSEHNNEEDELVQLKRRLKKQIMMKKSY